MLARLAPLRSPVVDALLGHSEVVGRGLHAVLIGVLHDCELFGMAEHTRLRIVRLESIRVLRHGELKVGVARSASCRPASSCRFRAPSVVKPTSRAVDSTA